MVARQKNLDSEDASISTANKRLKKMDANVFKAKTDLSEALRQVDSFPENSAFAQEAKRVEKRKAVADAGFEKALASSRSAKGTGSGRVGLLLPK